MKSISLFSGAGGMDIGFKNARFDIIWANDFDKDACNTYRHNHGSYIHQGDINYLMPQLSEKAQEVGGIDCLFGGPPCQGFSVAGKMDAEDPRSQLIWSYMEAIRLTQPASFVMENVKALAVLEKFQHIRERLFREAAALGYDVDLVVLNSKDFGVSQLRERMFFVGFKSVKNHFRRLIEKQKSIAPTLRSVLLSVGEFKSNSNNRICNAKITTASSPVLRKSSYAGMLFNGQGRPLNLDGYATTLPASMGGNRTPIIDNEALYKNKKPWIEKYHSSLIEGVLPIDSKDIPSYLRRLTVDEAMAIQTFPKEYYFHGQQSSVFKQIGNAVPCKLAEAVAKVIYNLLSAK